MHREAPLKMQLLVAIRRKTRKKVIEVHYGHDIIFITPFKHFVVPTFSISCLAWFYILLFELNRCIICIVVNMKVTTLV